MTSLICGSMAFDTIMSFHGRFSEALLADQLHKVILIVIVVSFIPVLWTAAKRLLTSSSEPIEGPCKVFSKSS